MVPIAASTYQQACRAAEQADLALTEWFYARDASRVMGILPSRCIFARPKLGGRFVRDHREQNEVERVLEQRCARVKTKIEYIQT